MAESMRGAERQAGNGAKVIFKLAGDRAFDGPVAGIVDARSHFVGEETAVVLEKFNGQNADVLQRLEHAAGSVFRGALEGGIGTWSGRDGKPQDSVTVMSVHQGIKG